MNEYQPITWEFVEQWARGALKTARENNEGDLDEVATAKVRGRIQTLNELLRLPDRESAMADQVKGGMPE